MQYLRQADHHDHYTMLNWQIKSFAELTTVELFDIYSLRQQVFILEQQCLYPDIDALDKGCVHVFAYADDTTNSDSNSNNDTPRLAAYLRIIPLNTQNSTPVLGRIVTAKCARGRGTGRTLVQAGIQYCREQWPDASIAISAQEYLRSFYVELGFSPTSDVYDEDGIPHLDMILAAES